MSEEMVVRDPEALSVEVVGSLGMKELPKEVLAQAALAADALMSVVSQTKKKVIFGGKQYLQYEHWQTVGRFYALAARTVSTQFVTFGEAHGFEASAEVVHLRTSQVVSSAEAMCLDDEPNWRGKPLFQLRSMAQTRACAKALRNALGWVAVLAGYEPTPAEEMDGVTPEGRTAGRRAAAPDIGDGESGPTFGAGTTERAPQASPAGRQPGDEDDPDFGLSPPEPPKPSAIDRGPNGEFWIGQQGQVFVTQVQPKHGSSAKGAWTLYLINFGKIQASTFDTKFGQLAEELMARKAPAQAELRPSAKYKDRYDLSSLGEWTPV